MAAAGRAMKNASSNSSVKSKGRHATLTLGPKLSSLPAGHCIVAIAVPPCVDDLVLGVLITEISSEQKRSDSSREPRS